MTFNTSTSNMPALNSAHFTAGSKSPDFNNPDKYYFINMRFCPFAQRTALVLIAKGIE